MRNMNVKLNLEIGDWAIENAIQQQEVPVLGATVEFVLVRQGEFRRVKLVFRTVDISALVLVSKDDVSEPVRVEVPPELQDELNHAIAALVSMLIETLVQLVYGDIVLPESELVSVEYYPGLWNERSQMNVELVIPRPIHNVPNRDGWWDYA